MRAEPQYHVNDLSIKLNRANALLFKMRKYYVSLKILRSIYFAILRLIDVGSIQ